jgi:hypothetical protein
VPKRLQLTASVAASQDLGAQRGLVQLTLGCNVRCLIRVSGSARRGAATMRLRAATRVLGAARPATISLTLGAAGRGALERTSGSASSELLVNASAPGQPSRSYRASVQLIPG